MITVSRVEVGKVKDQTAGLLVRMIVMTPRPRNKSVQRISDRDLYCPLKIKIK